MEMASDHEYIRAAQKIIYSLCTSAVADIIFKDPMRFGTVVNAIMMADWEFNGTGNIYGYRKQRAKWVIYKMIKEISTKKEGKKVRQLFEPEYNDLYDQKQKDFVNEIEQKDYIEYVEKKIQNSNLLSDNEKIVLIGKFLQDKTVLEISEELNVRGEAIRQTIKRAMTKIGQSLCI